MNRYFTLFGILVILSLNGSSVSSQTSIAWQKTFGTPLFDDALRLFGDGLGNIVLAGIEPHEDFTGDVREYLMITKMDADGNEIWKKYHDIPYEVHHFPGSYSLGREFITEESGQRILNIVVHLSGRTVLYKLHDASGEFYTYEEIESPVFTINQLNEKIYATTRCSFTLACYGPDSLTVQKLLAVPDSNFNIIDWTFGMKQNIRTAPIQGHYDFDNNDIAVDAAGNVYLLTQIERWDFLFCTDCNDEFVDAYSMIFKFDREGHLIDQERINITHAVVSHTGFLDVREDGLTVRINDINQQGTVVVTSIFHLDEDLEIKNQFTLDRAYNDIIIDGSNNLYALTNAYGDDPNIIGESDVLVAKFNPEGVLQWKSYYGGTSFDFPKELTLTDDGGIVFIANTSSDDFDIAENIGYQDIWLVKLEETTTPVKEDMADDINIYPNPASDFIEISGLHENVLLQVRDVMGRLVGSHEIKNGDKIPVGSLPAGLYFLSLRNGGNGSLVKVFMKKC